jgi:hypothetical protein
MAFEAHVHFLCCSAQLLDRGADFSSLAASAILMRSLSSPCAQTVPVSNNSQRCVLAFTDFPANSAQQ